MVQGPKAGYLLSCTEDLLLTPHSTIADPATCLVTGMKRAYVLAACFYGLLFLHY